MVSVGEGRLEEQQIVEIVWISFIQRTSTAKNLHAIYSDTNQQKKDASSKWNQIITAANSYEYAEQPPVGKRLKKWPNSKYQLPPGNNSNTFIHEMARKINRSADVFFNTPGATTANPVIDNGPTPTP